MNVVARWGEFLFFRIVGGLMMALALLVGLGFPGGFMFAAFMPRIHNDAVGMVAFALSCGVSLIFWLGVRSTRAGFSATEWYLAKALKFCELGGTA